MSDEEALLDPASQIVLSQVDSRPMYRQIQERIKQLVAAGDWGAGREIPSIRQLAVALQVSVITVKRAYLELEREGIIITRQGKGSMVAETPALGQQLKLDELEDLLRRVRDLALELGIPEDRLGQLICGGPPVSVIASDSATAGSDTAETTPTADHRDERRGLPAERLGKIGRRA